MRTRTARYDKRVSFLKPVTTKDPRFNTDKKEFVPAPGLKAIAANVQDLLPSRGERIAEGIDIRLRPSRIRLRWRGDITPDMRVQVGGRELEIVSGPIDLGRRETLELIAQEVSTQGKGA